MHGRFGDYAHNFMLGRGFQNAVREEEICSQSSGLGGGNLKIYLIGGYLSNMLMCLNII